MNQGTSEKVRKIAEEFFGTQNDPNQIPINQDSTDKLHLIHKDTIIFKFNEKGDPIAWIVVVPTSVDTMNKFLKKEITEKELLNIATEEKKFESLYLCAVFVLPEYRQRGYAKGLIKEAFEKIPNAKNASLYAWIYSKEGENLIKSMQNETGRKILFIKD
ncbi:MAG: Uncharacterized protein Athens071416_37 [Parcubacteria group bacterium Athens0714_16]|nr:MAG: Uncharacterized protein Athens071416_37 [Parcubacteria group bacterium Athens0714_16]